MSQLSGKLGYSPALDGLRGVAIALVLCAHFLGIVGGSLGVDLFFVLSGFLITTLLLEEWEERGRIRLAAFYARRARRLLPALLFLLAVYAMAAAAEGHNELRVVVIGGFYTANVASAFWHSTVLADSGLFHLWSLAEEEQFYLVWPLLLIGLIRSRRPTLWATLLVVSLVAYRVVLAQHGASHVRLYMGPDTHADGLVAGAVLAMLRRRGFTVGEWSSVAAFALLIPCVFVRTLLVNGGHGVAWDAYGLPVFELVSVLLVGAAVARTSLAEALAARPLVWLGKISYSLYLWHYAVIHLFAGDHLPAALAVSFAGAWVSWRFVERPFRRPRRAPTGTGVVRVASVG